MIEIEVSHLLVPLATLMIVGISLVLWIIFAFLVRDALRDKDHVLYFLATILALLSIALDFVLLSLLGLVNFV